MEDGIGASTPASGELIAPDKFAHTYLDANPETTIEELEIRTCTFRVEVGGIFDANGRLKWKPKVGDHREIIWCSLELRSMPDSTCTHNHPGAETFSEADLRMTAGHDVAVGRVVGVSKNTRYRYTITRPVKGWPETHEAEEVEQFLNNCARKFEVSRDEVEQYFVENPVELKKVMRAAALKKIYREAEQHSSYSLYATHDVGTMDASQIAEASNEALHIALIACLEQFGVDYVRSEF